MAADLNPQPIEAYWYDGRAPDIPPRSLPRNYIGPKAVSASEEELPSKPRSPEHATRPRPAVRPLPFLAFLGARRGGPQAGGKMRERSSSFDGAAAEVGLTFEPLPVHVPHHAARCQPLRLAHPGSA